jgi:signal transduction histidine kinase
MPLMALAVTLAGSVAPSLAPPEQIPASSFQVVAACVAGLEVCYTAATRTRRVSLTAVAVAGAGLPILVLEFPLPDQLPNGRSGTPVPVITVLVPLVMIIAWLIGNSIRQARGRTELVRAQAAAQTVMAERLRIARELHDIVAHSIGIIAIQAGSGRSVFDTSPAGARDALAAIEATSRETLSGLRRMMTGLRHAEPGSGPGQAPLGPAPGLADIERLAAMTLEAGVQVEVEWLGSREPLPADIDQQDGYLSIEVTDSGRGGGPAGTGYGITGMRERAALLDGDFSAGARPGGGFQVAARLPVPVPAR